MNLVDSINRDEDRRERMRYKMALDNVSLPPTNTPLLVAMLLPRLNAQAQRPGQNVQPVPLLLFQFRVVRCSNGLFIQTVRH